MDLHAKPFNGLKRYWRRRKYKRLDGGRQKRVQVVEFGGGSSSVINRRRFWKIRVLPKLRFKIGSPLKTWTRLKQAYIGMMFNLAGNVGSLNTTNVFGDKRIPKAHQAKIIYTSDEVENRLVCEIYNVLKASGQLSNIVP